MQSNLDIVNLIEKNPIKRFTNEYQKRFVQKLQDKFTDDNGKMFIASFYIYLNYTSKEFVVDLDNIWKWLGFGRKDAAKRVLQKHFTKGIDYIISSLEINTEERNLRGSNKEILMLNIETFKAFCMLSGTEKSKHVRLYYIKLEEILHEIISEEADELRNKIKIVQERPETEGICRNEGYIYIIKDGSKHGHYKIGYANDPHKRLNQLNTGSSEYTFNIVARFFSCDKELTEKLIHGALQPFRIRNRKEWFCFIDDKELAYAIHVIKDCVDTTAKYNFESKEHLMEKVNSIDIDIAFAELDNEKKVQEQQKQDIQRKIQNNAQRFKNKTGTYKGVCWSVEKQKWKAELKRNYVNRFLGYFDDEIQAAKAYNDYATFLNQTENCNYTINEFPDAPDYKPTPRNIPEDTKTNIMQNKSCPEYIGVQYVKSRKSYSSYIKYMGKSHFLGSNKDASECAKLYNHQAAYFNTLDPMIKYQLNEQFDQTPKNIIAEKSENKKQSSIYRGVMFCKQRKLWKATIVINKKQYYLGTFDTDIEAAIAYNNRAMEENQIIEKENSKRMLYELNDL